MDNRVGEIRSLISGLRGRMREAETVVREQIKRDEDCTSTAEQLIKMRVVMSGLARERVRLGDNDPITVHSLFIPRRPQMAPPRITKRRLVPHGIEQQRGHARP
ncbi:hypothetical protein GA0061098_102311 [Bradyrhizobium shewense]|uniref:Uncharacterized protein n=1 Tax=Bradyrhizobium shewense TaxID=1761772 RepID=A0A1C3XPS2_9BRAD|nr:hypothetical protein [Bradyrhizobium shewense]SCB54056.1 hypothetical protein GA0061098_102311 [Bradyrhizobium shewense]